MLEGLFQKCRDEDQNFLQAWISSQSKKRVCHQMTWVEILESYSEYILTFIKIVLIACLIRLALYIFMEVFNASLIYLKQHQEQIERNNKKLDEKIPAKSDSNVTLVPEVNTTKIDESTSSEDMVKSEPNIKQRLRQKVSKGVQSSASIFKFKNRNANDYAEKVIVELDSYLQELNNVPTTSKSFAY
ncbi:unnamed protein product [Brachionus calyciflorus]|uniref:Uncharacterized protein n=1 Tax=Brachionus calyciflorus TaxID=104777 RepID=A0A814JPJ6_9BILA|nr:unnamed protein product [Brachionus calyciflorus]